MADLTVTVGTKVSEHDQDELKELAHNLSSPDRNVTVADLLRHALTETFGIGDTLPNKGIDMLESMATQSIDSDTADNSQYGGTTEVNTPGLNNHSEVTVRSVRGEASDD